MDQFYRRDVLVVGAGLMLAGCVRQDAEPSRAASGHGIFAWTVAAVA